MVSEGQISPDFRLEDKDGTFVTLSAFRGQPVVLYFYPRDATPGCTTEACDFRNAHSEFEKAVACIIGISPDTAASHRKFVEEQGLPFTLLADPERQVCELYGVWKEKTFIGKRSMGVERTTFLLDADGVVRRVFPKVKVEGHVAKVLECVRNF